MVIRLNAYARDPRGTSSADTTAINTPSAPAAPTAASCVAVSTARFGASAPSDANTHAPAAHSDDRTATAEPVGDHAGDERDERADPHSGEHRALVAARRAELVGDVRDGLREQRSDVAVDQRQEAQQPEHRRGPGVQRIGRCPPRAAAAARRRPAQRGAVRADEQEPPERDRQPELRRLQHHAVVERLDSPLVERERATLRGEHAVADRTLDDDVGARDTEVVERPRAGAPTSPAR